MEYIDIADLASALPMVIPVLLVVEIE